MLTPHQSYTFQLSPKEENILSESASLKLKQKELRQNLFFSCFGPTETERTGI